MKRSKRLLIYIAGIAIILLCLLFFVFLYQDFFGELYIQRSLYVHPDATLQFEAHGHFGAGVDEKSLYYWINDSLKNVQSSYEKIYLPFQQGDPDNKWLITGFNVDGSPLSFDRTGSALGLESICNYQKPYQCVSISLIDLGKNLPYELAVSSVTSFAPEPTDPLYSSLRSLPSHGTLIIYSFYIADL